MGDFKNIKSESQFFVQNEVNEFIFTHFRS